MKQSKTIHIDFVTHKELKKIKKEFKFERIGNVILFLLNNYKHKQ